jgi:hypothetical protein
MREDEGVDLVVEDVKEGGKRDGAVEMQAKL